MTRTARKPSLHETNKTAFSLCKCKRAFSWPELQENILSTRTRDFLYSNHTSTFSLRWVQEDFLSIRTVEGSFSSLELQEDLLPIRATRGSSLYSNCKRTVSPLELQETFSPLEPQENLLFTRTTRRPSLHSSYERLQEDRLPTRITRDLFSTRATREPSLH